MNFHGVGGVGRSFEENEAPYWLSRDLFVRVLDMVAAHPLRSAIALTFDDGNHSDVEIAAPALLERGLSATMFVLTGKVGEPGYLSVDDLKRLGELGFRIGSHGVDHVRWDRIDEDDLASEVSVSLEFLRATLQTANLSVALPFGGYNHRVLATLAAHGVTEIYSSDGGPKLLRGGAIPRLSVQREVKVEELSSLISKANGFGMRMFRKCA